MLRHALDFQLLNSLEFYFICRPMSVYSIDSIFRNMHTIYIFFLIARFLDSAPGDVICGDNDETHIHVHDTDASMYQILNYAVQLKNIEG